jgi:hypothetical protein
MQQRAFRFGQQVTSTTRAYVDTAMLGLSDIGPSLRMGESPTTITELPAARPPPNPNRRRSSPNRPPPNNRNSRHRPPRKPPQPHKANRRSRPRTSACQSVRTVKTPPGRPPIHSSVRYWDSRPHRHRQHAHSSRASVPTRPRRPAGEGHWGAGRSEYDHRDDDTLNPHTQQGAVGPHGQERRGALDGHESQNPGRQLFTAGIGEMAWRSMRSSEAALNELAPMAFATTRRGAAIGWR